ncbi:MAG: PQQ-binding-like beta-propeller repeat protein, partial [Pedosphaera sp.]|nr:PQQ-binding-like beta-propeller repeat protein [Pedosphaera sp.]
MRMLHLLTILVAAGCGEKNKPEPLSKTKSPLSEKVQHPNQDSKAKVRTPIWEFVTGRWVFSSPAIGSDGTVYVGSFDNKLYAINGQTGVKLWELETGNRVQSSPKIGS